MAHVEWALGLDTVSLGLRQQLLCLAARGCAATPLHIVLQVLPLKLQKLGTRQFKVQHAIAARRGFFPCAFSGT